MTQDIWPSNCWAIAYVVSPKKFEEPWSIWIWYSHRRQSQTPPQGCHCWELQDEPFAFCGRIGAACVDLFNRVFSSHLIGFLLRATKQERKSALKILRYYVSKRPKAVFSASERKYAAAGGDVQVPWDAIHEWRKSEQKGLIHGSVKQRSSAWALLLRGD